MKKLLVLAILISSVVMANENVIETRLGFDLANKSQMKDSETKIKKVLKKGTELTVEYRREVFNGLELGAGLGISNRGIKKEILGKSEAEEVFKAMLDETVETYYFEKTAESTEVYSKSKSIKTLPLYVTGRYKFNEIQGMRPYVKANVGMAFNTGNEKLKVTKKVTMPKEGEVLAGEFGMDFKLKNGVYYGIGTGVEYKNWTVDLSYNGFNTKSISTSYSVDEDGDTDIEKVKSKVRNNVLTLNVGYGFRF